jgi:hypothetical protein
MTGVEGELATKSAQGIGPLEIGETETLLATAH